MADRPRYICTRARDDDVTESGDDVTESGGDVTESGDDVADYPRYIYTGPILLKRPESRDPLELANRYIEELELSGPSVHRIDIRNPVFSGVKECLEVYVAARLGISARARGDDVTEKAQLVRNPESLSPMSLQSSLGRLIGDERRNKK